jgi:transposase InsO family protein
MSTTIDAPVADAPNRVWAVDFQFDVTTEGRPIKIVSIIDEHTRECLGGLVERSITSDILISELDRLAAHRGYPAVLRCDDGPELACAALADWAGARVGLWFIPPGEPWRNGYVESFNSRVRDECLNINVFWSLAQARVVISDWKRQYNWDRPHSALGYQSPAHYAAICSHREPFMAAAVLEVERSPASRAINSMGSVVGPDNSVICFHGADSIRHAR